MELAGGEKEAGKRSHFSNLPGKALTEHATSPSRSRTLGQVSLLPEQKGGGRGGGAPLLLL